MTINIRTYPKGHKIERKEPTKVMREKMARDQKREERRQKTVAPPPHPVPLWQDQDKDSPLHQHFNFPSPRHRPDPALQPHAP